MKVTNKRHVIALLRPNSMSANGQSEIGGGKGTASENIVDVKASLGLMIEIKRVLPLVSVLTSSLLMIKATNAVLVEKANEVAELVTARWPIKSKAGVEVTCPDRIRLDKWLVVVEGLEQRLDVRPRIRMRHRPHGKK